MISSAGSRRGPASSCRSVTIRACAGLRHDEREQDRPGWMVSWSSMCYGFLARVGEDHEAAQRLALLSLAEPLGGCE